MRELTLSGIEQCAYGIHPMVKQTPIPRLIDLVRSALKRVEETEQSEDKEIAVQGLRRSVVRTMAEHELRTLEPTAPAEPELPAADVILPAMPEDSAA